MTGGGRGYCAVPVGARSLGLGWRSRSFWGRGVIGRGRGGFGRGLQRGVRGRWAASEAPLMPARWVDFSYDEELAELRTAATHLEGDLERVRARIDALETQRRRDPSTESEEGGQAG